MNKKEVLADPGTFRTELAQFNGTETWTRHLCGVLLTEGAVYVAESCGAWWLLDAIASYQLEPKFKDEAFQVWRFRKFNPETDGRQNMLDAWNDSPDTSTCLATQEIPYTDFPLDSIELWAVDGGPEGRRVILLPSEY